MRLVHKGSLAAAKRKGAEKVKHVGKSNFLLVQMMFKDSSIGVGSLNKHVDQVWMVWGRSGFDAKISGKFLSRG